MKLNLTQWVNLAVNAAALLVFLAGGALTLWQLHREKKGAKQEELAKLEHARQTLASLLQGSVFRLVTAAEEEYGSGMGEIKKSAVLAELIRLLPSQWRTLFDAEALGEFIEKGLLAAKALWSRQEEQEASQELAA